MKTAVIETWINKTSYAKVTEKICRWTRENQSHYVCAANVHMVMEAWDSLEFRNIVNSADIVTPDGMPLVWMLRLKGRKNQQRVYGPTLMLYVLERAAQEHIPVGFYGSKPAVLESLVKRMQAKYPGLNVAYSFSPPFRMLNSDEDAEVVSNVKKSGAKILFVGLGCPKQERWMAAHRGKIPSVMLGVGAAFNIHAGVRNQAPVWLQGAGLEWAYRFFQEPNRLWRRYVIQNPRFVVLAMADLLGLLRTGSN
jgi:N-acetylglucosaminyldiphosphoundecaprenol N-acetyl-beta-D-mannosaminyltransferase